MGGKYVYRHDEKAHITLNPAPVFLFCCLDVPFFAEVKAKAAKANATRQAEPSETPSLPLTEIPRTQEPNLDVPDDEPEELVEIPEGEAFAPDSDEDADDAPAFEPTTPHGYEAPTPEPISPTPPGASGSRPPPRKVATAPTAPVSGSAAASTEWNTGARRSDVLSHWQHVQCFTAFCVDAAFLTDMTSVRDAPTRLRIHHEEAPLACSFKISM